SRRNFVRILQRNTALVLGEPLVVRQKLRIQFPRKLRAPGSEHLFFEVAIDLEHIPEFVGPWETEAAIGIRLDRVVLDGADAETLGELLADLLDGQGFADYAHGLSDILSSRLENAIGAPADVVGGDAGQL